MEDKQRKARQHRERNKLPYAPKWFTKRVDPDTKESLWVYRGGYWSAKVAGDFGETPDIF